VGVTKEWDIEITDEARTWYDTLEPRKQARFAALLDELADKGPALTRPTSDLVKGTDTSYSIHELRSGSLRILYVFDPTQTAIVLVGGDKREAGWKAWYAPAIEEAKRLYADYLDDTGQTA